MNRTEYCEKYCSICANKENEKDLCNIVRNIDGELQCVNYKENEEKQKIAVAEQVDAMFKARGRDIEICML